MTVDRETVDTDGESIVTCVWFSRDGVCNRNSFNSEALILDLTPITPIEKD